MRHLLLAGLLACAKPATPVSPSPDGAGAERARGLVVLVVLDQFPLSLLEAGRPHFRGGLARLTGDRARQGVAVYPYATTQTCPGHVTLATGTEPARSGIVANDMLGADGESTYCSDLALLRTEPLADRVKARGGRVVALSLKDRASLFLGGHSPDLMAWYDAASDTIVGAPDLLPPERPRQLFAATWEPRAGLDLPDDRPFEGAKGLSPTFPHLPVPDEQAKLRLATPMAGTLLTEMAIAAVGRHALGQGEAADFLSISYSNTDYVGHYYTASSLEALDNLLSVDEDLDRLFSHLDATVGADRWTVILTSDHGGEDAPEDYIEAGPIEERVASRLAAAGLDGTLAISWPEVTVRGVTAGREAEAYAIAVEEIRASEGVLAAFTIDAIPEGEPWSEAVRLSYDPERSAPIYGISREGVVFDWYDQRGSDHGSPHDYDRRVPLLAYGAGVSAGDLGEVDARSVAPTLTALAGAERPRDCRHDPLVLE